MPRVIWITMMSTLITGCVCSPMTGTRVLSICFLSRCEMPPRPPLPVVDEPPAKQAAPDEEIADE